MHAAASLCIAHSKSRSQHATVLPLYITKQCTCVPAFVPSNKLLEKLPRTHHTRTRTGTTPTHPAQVSPHPD